MSYSNEFQVQADEVTGKFSISGLESFDHVSASDQQQQHSQHGRDGAVSSSGASQPFDHHAIAGGFTPFTWTIEPSISQLVQPTQSSVPARFSHHLDLSDALRSFSRKQRIDFWTTVADPFIIASHPRAFILDPRSKITYELNEGVLELKGIRGAVYRFRKDRLAKQVLQILTTPPMDGMGQFHAEDHIFRLETPVRCDPSVITHQFSKRNWQHLLQARDFPEYIYWNSRLRRPLSEDQRVHQILLRGLRYQVSSFTTGRNAQVSA